MPKSPGYGYSQRPDKAIAAVGGGQGVEPDQSAQGSRVSAPTSSEARGVATAVNAAGIALQSDGTITPGTIKDYTPFASSLQPVGIVNVLPAAGAFDGQLVILTTDHKLYRWNAGTATWTAAVPTVDLTGTIDTAQIADLAVTAAKIGAAAVIAGKIAAAAVSNAELADLAVSTAKVQASAITTAQIADAAVATGKLAALAVTNAQLADLAVSTAKVQASAITTAQIADAAVAAGKVAAGQLDLSKLTASLNAALSFGDARNKLFNPGFESGSAYWQTVRSGAGGTVVTNSANARSGNKYFEIVTTSAAESSQWYTDDVGTVQKLEVMPGDVIKWGCYANEAVGSGAGVYFYCETYDKDGAHVLYTAAGGAGVGAYNIMVGELTIPAGTKYASFFLYVVNAAVTARFDDCFVIHETPGADIVARSIAADRIIANTITANEIAANTITAAQIAAATITATEIAAGAITTSQLAALAVTAAKIAAGTITSNEIAATTIVAGNIAGHTITAAQIAAATITATEIAAGAITTSQLAALAVTAAKIAAGTITSNEIAALTIIGANIAARTIDAAKIVANTITAGEIAAGTITATQIAASTITSGQIAASTILASNIAALTITGAVIAANTITADKLVANSITAGQIQAGAIGATQIAAGAITAGKLAVGTGGAALNSDPGCTDLTAWEDVSGGGGGSIVTLTDGKTGATALRGGPSTTEYGSHRQPYDPTKSYRVRAWARRDATANGTLYIGIGIRDHSGALIGPGNNYIYIAAAGVVANAAFTEYVGTLAANYASFVGTPETMQIVLLLNYGGTVGYMEVQDVRLEEVLPSTLIEDGAITTAKMTANTINGDRITAGTLDASKIVAASITAAQIAAGTITTTQIAANTITAANIAAATITATQITVGTITADRIVNNSLGPTQTQSRFRCKVYNSAAIVIGNNAYTLLSWDTEAYDSNALHDLVTNPTRITIPAGGNVGVWRFTAQVTWGNSNVGLRYVAIFKNGSATQFAANQVTGDANGTIQTVVVEDDAPAVGDYYEVKVGQASGGNLSITGGVANSWFSAIHSW